MVDKIYPSGWKKPCPMGGLCIDPGNPTDCEANRRCFSFQSVEDKSAFDAQPDRYAVSFPELPTVLFKTKTQVDFFLTDLPLELKEVAIVTRVF
jgi:hypothetical protein